MDLIAETGEVRDTYIYKTEIPYFNVTVTRNPVFSGIFSFFLKLNPL
jgi:hypothetical protein